MRKNWKRILAAVLVACMIFCDSSLVYATETQPIVETPESETEVEATEIGDETILPEATEEEIITEEPTEETEQEELLPEEEPVEEEKEVVEIMPVTEVDSVEKMNTSAIDETEINNTLTVNQVVSVSGGENGVSHTKGYTFIPETSGYYYLESDVLRDYSYAVYDESMGYYDYSPNLPVRCVRKDNAATIKDVVTSHYFEEGKSYLVYITGTVSANSFATFTWKECTAPDNSTEVCLGGELIPVPGGEVSIYKLCAEETTVANVLVNGWDLLEVYGDNYKGLPYGYTVDNTKQHENVMAVGKGKTYYYVLAPTEDATITFTTEETKTIKAGEEFTVEAPSDAYYDIVCHEFTPKTGAKYEAHYGIGAGNKAIAIMEKDGKLSWVNEGTITGSDGKLWTEINATDNIEKVYLFTLAEAGTPQTVALKSDAPADNNNMTLNTFDGSIILPAGNTVTVTYAGPHLGDYFIDAANAGVKFEHISAAPELELKEYNNMGTQYAYVLSDDYYSNTTETTTFTFKIINEDTVHNKTVWISSSASYIIDESYKDSNGNLVVDGRIQNEQAETYATYYRFAINETGDYYHPEMVWILKEQQDVDGNKTYTRWDTDAYKVDDNTYTLNAGETYIVKFLSYRTLDDQRILEPFEITKNWIAYMEVQTEKTLLAVGESLQLEVTTIGENSNSPAEGKVAYTTSNKAIATVDENGEIKALKEGAATITVIANAGRPDKQFEKTYAITVSPKYQIIYNGIDSEGAISKGYLAEGTPFEFYKNEGTTLVDPVVNEGYEFLGWYSDAKKTKKVTSIAKGTKTNVNLWPKFELKNYIINYEFDYDEKFAADANQPLTFTIDKATYLAEPIRLGYKFVGWICNGYNEIEEGYLLKKKSDSNNKTIYYIPEETYTNIDLVPQWEFDTKFSLEINGEKEVITDVEGNQTTKYTITHPYNSATGEWDYINSSFIIKSDIEGVLPEVDYNDCDIPTVQVSMFKYNQVGETDPNSVVEWNSNHERPSYEGYINYYEVTDILAKDIQEPGRYLLKVLYNHPGQEEQILEQEFNVEYAKREYPVIKEVSWSKLSNIDPDFTYGMIKPKIASAMQPEDSAFIGSLGETRLTESNVILINSKNKVVKDTAKVTSGIYTVILEFGENDRFLTEATGTVNICYSTVKNAGVTYAAIDENDKTAGRIIGSTIAFKVPKIEGGEATFNSTSYASGVEIIPMVNVPWNDEAITVEELNTAFGENGYAGYSAEVMIKENSKKEFLNFEGKTDSKGNTVAYDVTGNAAGKVNLVFETIIYNNNGETPVEVMRIPTTIKNFTVVSGGKDAVQRIEVGLYHDAEREENVTIYNPATNTFLLEKTETARTYWVDAVAYNYEDDPTTAVKLNWKTSNSKLATVKATKDGTVTVTIPKNAQGVVEVTVTANDVTKNSATLHFVIEDTSMRLDTTSLTMNSKLEGESAVAYLYPNVLASDYNNDISLEDLFVEEGRIALYDRKKSGKTYIYEPSKVFTSSYDVLTGELTISFIEGAYPAKAATHTVYVGVLHEGDVITKDGITEVNPSEVHALKIKDICALPKAPSIKVTKNYEVVYKEGWAELTLSLKERPAHWKEDENGEWIPNIQSVDSDLVEIVEWNEIDHSDVKQWKLKVHVKDESKLPTTNQKSSIIKNVEFAIIYDGYRQDSDATAKVKTNITVVRTIPTLYTYGEDAYAPVYYTDADYRYVDVVIPVAEEIIDGIVSKEEYWKEMEINDEATGAYLKKDGKQLKVTLADPSKFAVISADCYTDYDDEIPGKKGFLAVDKAIVLTVRVDDSQTKNVNLQFHVESTGLNDGMIITTQKLTIKPRKIASESIKLSANATGFISKVTFNSNYAGKENVKVFVDLPTTLHTISEHKLFYNNSYILVEAADKKTAEMIQNNELLLDVDEDGYQFEVTSTSDSFKYKSAKLKVTVVTEGNIGFVKTKRTVLTINLKKALTPKITVANAKLIRGIHGDDKGGEEAEYFRYGTSAKVSYANMPVGSEVIRIRYADQADYAKYYTPEYYGVMPNRLFIETNPEADLTLGKDVVDLIYDVRIKTGDVIEVPAKITLTVTDSFSLKTDVKSINLYNSALGIGYGRYVTFSDAKEQVVEVKEIINAEELRKAGINFECTATSESDRAEELEKEFWGEEAIKFYVDPLLKRGIEKTYTVKVKVAVVNSAIKNSDDTWTTTTATEKILTFKIVLKK